VPLCRIKDRGVKERILDEGKGLGSGGRQEDTYFAERSKLKGKKVPLRIRGREDELGRNVREKYMIKSLGGILSWKEMRKRLKVKYGKHYLDPIKPRKRFCSNQTKVKLRLAMLKYIGQKMGAPCPNYNISACEYFKMFDRRNKTKGKYAMYGGGEHFIRELGYFVDYFNSKLKLIIEYDEKYHYDKNGNLKEKDIIRQKEIQAIYPNYEFRRIQETK
jgi:hypothetical protein